MADTYLLGIDLGTTTCRAGIFDLDGHEIAAAYQETPVRYPRPLWAEIDPEEWWRSTTLVVRGALMSSHVAPDKIGGVGLSGLMHAPVLVDGDGRPVIASMLWMDQRCTPQCEKLRSEAVALGRASPLAFSTGQSAPKLRWLAEMHPETLARARTLMLPKDFVRYRLTGVDGTDPSDAGGTGMFDREAGDWDWDVVRLVGVRRELMPTIRPSASLAGGVTRRAAEETGLREGTPVAVGGADTLCTRLGAGPLAPDEVCIYLGTAAWIAMMGPAGPDGRPIVRGFGATSTTGAALRWVRDLLGVTAEAVSISYETLTRQAADVPPGSEGLFFLPHLMGERGPTADPLARGALVGLTLRHGRPEVVRAVLEGTAFHLRRLIDARSVMLRGDGSGPSVGVACGGAARSSLWMQLLADVTHLRLRVPAVAEAGALGAAMLGGAAAGLLLIEMAPSRMVRFARTYQPVPTVASRYDDLYARYCALDDLLAPWFREGNSIGDSG